ncbi:unnamed protein product [Candida verbasci]|uniref:Leukotriene A(4) hydrolase n=1 Tax=Candida verbasci TaxID=1227364 RepID=A0A9W4TW77_9ASCO|nr:unnamed protein product [Candida verbasci]
MNVIEKHRPKHSPEIDHSTLSNYQNFKVNSTDLHFNIHFEKRIVTGVVTYDLTNLTNTDKVELDTSYLVIYKAFVNDEQVDFKLHERSDPLGSKLSIAIPELKEFKVKVEFETTDKCTALQFLPKEATDGKKEPYLFCQCQAIHARSLFPSFDTPAIKSTFTLSATSPLPTLMSGLPVKQEDNTYYFKQPVPIPSYLISIASGDLTSAEIGPRSKVYSEPCNIDDCKWEFEKDMENFIQIAEKLIFQYEWTNFDSLIITMGYPYGGMECPNLCQLTPTLICKDRSQVSVVAHELAHSWSGNLVTNCSWNHFWLNEGWTVYLERRILEALAVIEAKEKGIENPEAYGESVRQFNAIIGWTDLENNLKAMGSTVDKYSTLVQDLKNNEDPDDAFSTVPYEKGFNLLYLIEKTVGKSNFNKFIPKYFNHFKNQSLDTYQFIDYLFEQFPDQHKELDSIDWETWLYKPGFPPVDPKFDTSLVVKCYKLSEKWLNATKHQHNLKFSKNDIESFTPNQSVVFLDSLISYEKIEGISWKDHQDVLNEMSKIYTTYNETLNAEIKFRWYYLLVTGHLDEYEYKLADWLGTVGRMKFVRPGYVLLNEVDSRLATETYCKFKDFYHPICSQLVKKDLGL